MQLSRRKLLSTVAAGGAVALAGCTSAQVQQFQSTWASVVDAVQSAVAAGAQYIPTVESIIATAASLFGPAYSSAVQIGTAAFNSVVSVLINVVAALTPPASSRLRARLRGTSPSVPTTIGTTSNGVTVTGYKV